MILTLLPHPPYLISIIQERLKIRTSCLNLMNSNNLQNNLDVSQI